MKSNVLISFLFFVLAPALFSSCGKLSPDNVFPKGERVFYTCNVNEIRPYDTEEYHLFSQEILYAIAAETTASLYGNSDTNALIKKIDSICSKYNHTSLYGTLTLSGSSESIPAHVIKSWVLEAAEMDE